jgi:hypothetical protein
MLMIVKASFARGSRERAASHLGGYFKYIEYRDRVPAESRASRHLFDERRDHVTRKEALKDVMEHTSTSVNYHTVILSPGADEPVEDLRQWTREVMGEFEQQQGKDLHWFGVTHYNTEHPHVHVIIAGAGKNLETSEIEPVKFYRQDYDALREVAREHTEYRQVEYLKELNTFDQVPRELEAKGQEYDIVSERVSRQDTIDYDKGDFER